MRGLMRLLGSNLDPNKPVLCDWGLENMRNLYGQHTYRGAQENEPEHNVWMVSTYTTADNVNGAVDPARFQQQMDAGLIRAEDTENVRACSLEVCTCVCI